MQPLFVDMRRERICYVRYIVAMRCYHIIYASRKLTCHPRYNSRKEYTHIGCDDTETSVFDVLECAYVFHTPVSPRVYLELARS